MAKRKPLTKMRNNIEKAIAAQSPVYLTLLEQANKKLYDKAMKQIEKFKSGSAKERSKKFKHTKWENHIRSLSGN